MPNNKMERFTQRARRVLTLAQEYAERLHHNAIDSQHMLMALHQEEGGIAGRVLRDIGIEQRRLEELIEELTPESLKAESTTADLTIGSKRILELGVDEARRMGHHYIGTEHLLLGMVRVDDSTAIQVLKRLGIGPEEVRRITRRILQESPTQTSSLERPIPVGSRPPPNRPVQYVSAGSMYLMESMINKMLDMVGEGKLTVAQANEMLATLQPGLRLNTGMQAWLATLVNQKEKHTEKQVHIVVSNVDTEEILFDFTLSLLEGLEKLDQLLLVTVPDNELKGVAFDSSTSPIRIVVNVEKRGANA